MPFSAIVQALGRGCSQIEILAKLTQQQVYCSNGISACLALVHFYPAQIEQRNLLVIQ